MKQDGVSMEGRTEGKKGGKKKGTKKWRGSEGNPETTYVHEYSGIRIK